MIGRLACGEAERLWLRQADGSVGRFNRWRLARHLETCVACRSFVVEADALLAAPAPAAEPPARIAAAVHLAAVAFAHQAGPRAREAEARRWAGAFVSGAVAAALFGLVLAVAKPTIFSGRPARPVTIEERLAMVQRDSARLLHPASAIDLLRMSDEDRVKDVESQLRCLENQVDQIRWDSLDAGAACPES